MQIEKFNPTKAEIRTAVDSVKELTIKDVADVVGYAAVKAARKNLGDYRIEITKFGKKQREEAIAWQREVLRQEKELLAMIEPTETKLKAELEAVDEQKKIEERRILLPTRTKMLEELGIVLLDAEILRMDEKEFSAYYSEQKIAFLERKEEIEKGQRELKEREDMIERIKKETAEKAVAEERDRAERDKAEQVRKEESRIAAEKEDQEKTEKNRKYKAWLKKNGWTQEANANFIISRNDNTFIIFKKIDEITIK